MQNLKDILIKASNGTSDYGNKFSQPLINGSVLTFEHSENNINLGYDSYNAGRRYWFGKKPKKKKVRKRLCSCSSGDNYRIGMGGGAVITKVN